MLKLRSDAASECLAAIQADATVLGEVYDSMAATFAEWGLNLPAVQLSRCAPSAWLPHIPGGSKGGVKNISIAQNSLHPNRFT